MRPLAALVLVIYPAVAFYPYQWDPPAVARNTAEQRPEGGLRFAAPGPTVARTEQPPDWTADAKRDHRFELDLNLRTATRAQAGPARILTLSRDPWNHNFTIGQEGADLIVRLRTSPHNPNGLPQFQMPGVFEAPRWVDIHVAVEPGQMQVVVDGVPVLQAPLSARPLEAWNPSYDLALGNELTGDRPWFGEVRRAIVEAGSDRVDYAAPGGLRLPKWIWSFHVQPRTAPFAGPELHDVLVNLLGFIPFGALIWHWARRKPAFVQWSLGLLSGLAASLILESFQLCFPPRVPAIDDVILNALGALLGFLSARWVNRVHTLGARSKPNG